MLITRCYVLFSILIFGHSFAFGSPAIVKIPTTTKKPENVPKDSSLAAAEPLDTVKPSLRLDTDSGIVTNQAVTVAGQDFYQYFSSAWREKEGSDKYTIAIHERPSARWGSEVWIEYAQRRVFRTILPPARAAIKPIAERSADAAYQAVLQADTQRQLANDADLGRDEI